jgi:S1-C subfamily serine protease
LYESPSNYPDVVSAASRSTFEISCNGDWVGTGWAVNMNGQASGFLVTAFHVIEECVDDGVISARNQMHSRFPIELVSYDGRYWDDVTSDNHKVRDLALLTSDIKLVGLEIEVEKPDVGHWLTLVGYPGIHSGRNPLFTFGSVSGFSSYQIITVDAATNKGNSGGPVLNSKGLVVGTFFASARSKGGSSIGFVQPLSLHCEVIFECLGTKPSTPLEVTRAPVAELGK